MSIKTFSLLFGVSGLVAAAPALRAPHLHQLRASNSSGNATGSGNPSYPCGPVQAFYNPTQADWNSSGTDQFLQNWIANNNASIQSHSGTGGFVSAFSQYALGNPDATCKIDGSTNCNFDFCDNPVLNGLNDTRNTFYVLQSLENLHSYFVGLQQSLEMSALLSAFQTDTWTSTFYTQGDRHSADDSSDHGITALKEILGVLSTVVGVAAAFVAPETIPAIAALTAAEQGAVGIAKGAATAIFSGAIGAANTAISASNPGGNNFQHASEVSSAIGNVIQASLNNLINENNVLMGGGSIDNNGTGLANFLSGGGFLNASVDEVSTTQGFNTMIQGMAINQLWRQNKVFVMGGGQCGDNQGIGNGPQNATWCDPATNTAWYLYFWQANDVISTTSHQWGWVAPPPGAEQLGSGQYQNITVANVIESSVKAYQAAGYNYTSDVMAARMADAVQTGSGNPMADGAAWEGIFSIPVCNVSQAVNQDYPDKQYILQDYGHDSRPVWCGPICDNNLDQTKLFINATLMEDFQSPRHLCSSDPGYASLN